MNSLRWPILLLLAFCAPFLALAQPANSAAIVAPEISDSENRKFRLVIESIPSSTSELQATMLKVDGSSTTTYWVARIPYFRRPIPSPQTFVSNKGDFFVRVSSGDNVTLYRKDPRSAILRGNSKFGPLIYKLDDLFPGVDETHGVDVLRLWNYQDNRWDAYNTVDATEVHPTSEDIARWNEITRRGILEKLYDAQREAIRRKAVEISPPLGRIAGRTATARAAPMLNDYLFLATLRGADDRKWIERLIENGSPTVMRRVQFLRGGDPHNDNYFFKYTDYTRAQADWLLGFWDKKASWQDKSFLWSNPEYESAEKIERYSLGKIIGTIRLPMPMPIYQNPTQATRLHIRLIRAQDLHKNQSAREERIAASIGFERAHDRRFVYDARFAFTTVLPGKYHLKAIWDKRAPHSDTNSAGPGDYETFVSPQIIVKAGATVTNLLFCTNRIAGGEAYYRADELFAEKWVAENPPAPPPSPPRRYPVEADHEIHR
jgi:hypothetical protein